MFKFTGFNYTRPAILCFALALLATHTLSAQTFTISGQVTKSPGGTALSGVTITLSGSQTGSAITDTSGNYSFTEPSGGNYTVTPSLSGYGFAPGNYVFNNLSMNETGNFTASASAPPLIQSSSQPNLFFGATPPNGPNGPVLVLVHGLDGTYQDWIQGCTGNGSGKGCPPNSIAGNCPTTITNCSGSNNVMYNAMYNAGFRVAIMSLNLDNSPNSASIQQNAAMLQLLFPQILSYFNVSKVYFVAHSKGGLDLQDALANPQWLSMANMVLMLSTPNQGDALATWCYTPAGGACSAFGLLSPALQSMEVANVLQLRSQWDPVFENSKIPFYTLAGNTYNCVKSVGGCSTTLTGPILCTITGGTANKTGGCQGGAPQNDGLVTEPESELPTTYAMQLGIINTNHYGMVQGVNSFSFIQGRVTQLENSQPGFNRISTGGFGDQHNTWNWSMAWFQGKLYVGTGREVYCVTSATAFVKIGAPGLYPPAIGDCSPDYHDLPLQAEIWQYTPGTNTWIRVFQSPNSLTTTDNTGKTVSTARDIGFRSLTLVTEPGNPPVQALYAGGVTSGEIFECNPSTPQPDCPTPVTTWPPPRILRSTDGVHWAPLPQSPGTFLGNLTVNGTSVYPNYSIRAGQQLNGVLFLQVGDYPGVGRVICTLPGTNPAGGNNNFTWASPPTADLPVWILNNYNGYVYAGTGTPPGAPIGTYGVFKTDAVGSPPYNWTPIITDGAYAVGLISDYAMSMQVFATPGDPSCGPPTGCLYYGTDRPNEMGRIHPDDSWDLVIGNPRTCPVLTPCAGQLIAPLSGIGQYFTNGFTGHFWREGVNPQGTKMYMGTWDWSADNAEQVAFAPFWSQEFGTDLWSTTDGIHWTSVSKIGLGDGYNTGTRSFATTPFGLYMGTAREVGGSQAFLLDNSNLDYNNDGVIDMLDVDILQNNMGQPALAGTPQAQMDLNQNGVVDSTDLSLLQTQCTYPGCQVPTTLPSYITVAAPVLSSAAGSLGGTVSLAWNAVSNAAYYSLYRIAVSPSETSPPPGNNGTTGGTASLTAGLATANPALVNACHNNAYVARLQTCAPYATPATLTCGQPNSHCGFPGPPQLLGRFQPSQLTVCGSPLQSPPCYTEPSIVPGFQALYYIRAEDSSGNLSSPSNIVGGPSLASN